MSKLFETGTIVKIQGQVIDTLEMSHENNEWRVIDHTRDRENNYMFYLQNINTEYEPEKPFYMEELYEGIATDQGVEYIEKEEDRREATSELLARQPDEIQKLYSYIEHAEEDLLIACQGRATKDQNLDSVFCYLNDALAMREELLDEVTFKEKPKATKAELLNRLLDLRGEFATIDEYEDTDLDNELLETIQGYATRHNIEVVHELDGDINFKERPPSLYWVAWNPSYYDKECLSDLTTDKFFTEDNGFSADDAEAINGLAKNETHKIYNPGGIDMIITRYQ